MPDPLAFRLLLVALFVGQTMMRGALNVFLVVLALEGNALFGKQGPLTTVRGVITSSMVLTAVQVAEVSGTQARQLSDDEVTAVLTDDALMRAHRLELPFGFDPRVVRRG